MPRKPDKKKEKAFIGVVHNHLVPEAASMGKSLIEALGAKGESWMSSADEVGSVGDDLAKTRAIITVGGDGTILRTVRAAAPAGVPILGVNMGRVGFMTELKAQDAVAKVKEYIHGSPWTEERTMLVATLASNSGPPKVEVHGLNDVVTSRGAMAKLLEVKASIDGAPMTTYRADGVIVATATGSTGYALAAGGPILHPRSQEMVLLPIAGHMCLQTPLVLVEDTAIVLHIVNDAKSFMSVDGFVAKNLKVDDRITVRRSPHVARFLRTGPPETFYTMLTRRLGIVER
ncbi:MAG: NAD(+)/NADH kinase [SAR202 cluster bacterium]|nr:NAD(+)/NADH kinase [SAR202 cluster bacterium]